MDRIRTLVLARMHVVVLDPDLVANAATRPSRDVDLDKFEDELAQLGFVMSLDLALTIRRLPYQAIRELRGWMAVTLAEQVGARRPHVPLGRELVPGETSLYLRRIVSWLGTAADQPCPWCGELRPVGALDPCGHLVCRTCWDAGNFSGCPICHRRTALGDPFVKLEVGERVTGHAGTLTLLHLAFDVVATARERFERLVARATPLSPADRVEVEAVIDEFGPNAVDWLPARIPVVETVAIVVARLWLVAPDRRAMAVATAARLATATDVLRVAAVLMGGDVGLARPMRLRSLARGLRRAVIEALDRLPVEQVAEDVMRHRGLWKRIGERLHPFEWADRMPNATLAFAIARGTNLARASFGPALRQRASSLPFVRERAELLRPIAWAGPIEDALRAGNPRSALARLTQRPGELLRRADQLVRLAEARQLEAFGVVLKAIEIAARSGTPAVLLTLASHVARRGAPWPRRVFFPNPERFGAWGTADRRPPLRGDAIGSVVGAVRAELCRRAEARRHFPRAVIDRALVDLLAPVGERSTVRAGAAKLVWPRGSEVALPAAQTLRLFLHGESLAVALFDDKWRHVATCDHATPVIGARRAAAHAKASTFELVDLQLGELHALGARHVVMVGFGAWPSEAFAGLSIAPTEGTAFEPRAVALRFDLAAARTIRVPLSIDLADRRLRWLDVRIAPRGELHRVGGYRAALARLGRDFADHVTTHARPTMWDVACIHAAARANIVYVRERDGSITAYRRRDRESTVARLGRLMSGSADDGRMATLPITDAPTWAALITGDVALPAGSTGYLLDGRAPTTIEQIGAGELVTELAR